MPGEEHARTEPLEVYSALQRMAPAERTDLIARLIGAHPEGRLELPARDGLPATLNGIDFAPPAGDQSRPPRWWDPKAGGVNLRRAVARGAALRGARLDRAVLEEADLRGADLSGLRAAGAVLAGADLSEGLLKEADLTGASLRFARLMGTTLEGTNLRGADLWGVVGPGAVLINADMAGVTLEESDLQRAGLRDAGLRDACLQEVDLTHCRIDRVHLANAWLERIRFRREQLGLSIGEELASFSLLTMAQLDTGQASLEPGNEYVYRLSGVEALLTIFLTGLVGFVVGNRIRR